MLGCEIWTTALKTPPNWKIKIHYPQPNKKWEAKGIIGITYKDLFRATIVALRARTALTTFQWVKRYSGTKGNQMADALAKEDATKTTPDKPNLNIDTKFNLTGAQLLELTQALVYEGICKQRSLRYNRGLNIMLDITHFTSEDAFGTLPSDEKIWKSIHNKDLLRPFQTFLWKTLQNLHKVGECWENT